MGSLFSVFGLVYAIIVGLLIVEAHRRQRELSAVVQAELNALGDINDFLRYFNGRDTKNVKSVTQSLKLCCDDVGNDTEARKSMALSTSVSTTDEEKDEVLHVCRRQHIKRLIRCISELRVVDKNDSHALQAMMDRVSALTSIRAQKTLIARLGCPKVYYTILIFMTAVVIVSFIVVPVDEEWLHFFKVFAVALATIILVTIVYDLDEPLDGFWSIRREVFASIEIISQNIDAHLQAVDELVDFRAKGLPEHFAASPPSGVAPASPHFHSEASGDSPESQEVVVFVRERNKSADGPGSS